MIRIIAIMLGISYVLTTYIAYQEDHAVCAEYGRGNTLSISLEGYCTKPLSDGSTEYIPVERFYHPHKYGFQPQ